MNDCGASKEYPFFLFFPEFSSVLVQLGKVLSYGGVRNVMKCMTWSKCRDRMVPKRRICVKVLSYDEGNMVCERPAGPSPLVRL